jgi:hypothetical protein
MAPPENGVTEGMVTTDMPDGKPIPAVATPEWVAALYAATPAYSLPAAVPAAPPTTLPPGGMPNAMPSPLGPAAYPSPYSYSGMCPVPGSGYPY